MKNILVLTDFSPNAEHAAEAAFNLASKLHVDILLFYSYQGAPVIPYYGDPLFPAGEVIDLVTTHKEHLSQLSDRLMTLASSFEPGQYVPKINSQLGEGSLSDNAGLILKKEETSLVVMGASDEKGIDHILSGSSVNEIIENISCPVLVIPKKSAAPGFRHIIFATTYAAEELKAMQMLKTLTKSFKPTVEIVHVMQKNESDLQAAHLKVDFIEGVASLNFSHISYRDISGENVAERLAHLAVESSADVLAIYHHQRSFFGRLFEKSTVKKMLSAIKTSVLIFPSKMQS